jgi:uroporphyrinogen-III synthase
MAGKYTVLSTKKLSPVLIEQAKEKGIDLTEHSFISTHPVIHEKEQEILYWLNKQTPFYAVFTSANAVEATASLIKHNGLTPAWKIFSIEGRTSETLKTFTPPGNILETAEYGKELAEKIITYPVKELVFFCGNRRRDELPEILKRQNIAVHELVVYQTIETPAALTGNWDGILFFSPSAVNSYFSSNRIDTHTVCFAIGRTTAESIAQHTGNPIIISSATNQAALIDGVWEYFNDQGTI